MTRDCVYHILVGYAKVKHVVPLKIRLVEHRKAVARGDTDKSGIVDYVKKKYRPLPL